MKVEQEATPSPFALRTKPESTVFTFGRRAAAFAAALAGIAMLIYPGGTLRDHSTRGYSLTHNFLSDLGSTVTFGGQPNSIGALLFVSSLVIVVLGVGACLAGFVKLFAEDRATRNLARGTAVVGAFVCASFLGVAFTPEDRFMALHVQFTLWAFRVFPLVPLLLAVATARDARFPRRTTVAWLSLALVGVAYAADLQWGPTLSTSGGLAFQVIAQKIVAVTAVLVIAYQSFEADRVILRRT